MRDLENFYTAEDFTTEEPTHMKDTVKITERIGLMEHCNAILREYLKENGRVVIGVHRGEFFSNFRGPLEYHRIGRNDTHSAILIGEKKL